MGWKTCVISLVIWAVSAFPAVAEEVLCFKYEPQVVELKGTLKQVVFPGPPHFTSIERGDTPETYWVLELKREVCVDGDPGDALNTEPEDNIGSFQLILDNYDRYRKLVGKGAIVTGRLLQGFTGHHHTPVLVYVDSIKKDPADRGFERKNPVKQVIVRKVPARKPPVKRELVRKETTRIAQAR